jgi:hypothetical protein
MGQHRIDLNQLNARETKKMAVSRIGLCASNPRLKRVQLQNLQPSQEDVMSRSINIAFLTGVILVAFAALPPMLPGSTMMSLSGSALAQKTTPTTNSINLNSSRSNVKTGNKGGTAGPAVPTTHSINLHSSRSNVYRKK